MKLTVLIDNNTLIDRYFLAEPAVSYLIEDRDTKVLFDVGYSDAFMRNAHKMGIGLLDVDTVALSHGHIDHTGGIEPLMRAQLEAALEGVAHRRAGLVCHPAALVPKWLPEIGNIGMTTDERALGECFTVHKSRKPVWLTDRLVFLGEIPRVQPFEPSEPVGMTVREGTAVEDFVLDDTALAYVGAQGLVVITGCSHSGICNITEHARSVCSEDRVVSTIGGLHLQSPSRERLEGTARYLGGLSLDSLFACHCTDLASKLALSKDAPLEEVGVGLTIGYE